MRIYIDLDEMKNEINFIHIDVRESKKDNPEKLTTQCTQD